ncbi:MAG TPA: transposase [Candidatus Paceibacterota bacterium]|nr:transposase [Candidatus Paceibacterota bacterium]
MARNYVFAPGEYYHLYARGVEKMPVYRDGAEYQRFLEGMYLFNAVQKGTEIREIKRSRGGLTSADSSSVFSFDRGRPLVDIGAYCLMPNHFHILVRENDSEGKGVSKFMQRLMTSYTMYFNKKNERTGALFGSSFKARHVTEDTHLKYLFAYIHLNPREIVDAHGLRDYEYSSYADYVGRKRIQQSIINPAAFPDYFSGGIGMERELDAWLKQPEWVE